MRFHHIGHCHCHCDIIRVWGLQICHWLSYLHLQFNIRQTITMRRFVLLLVFISLMNLWVTTGADPSYNETLFQGDIMLTESQRQRIFNDNDTGITQHNVRLDYHWPGGIIPYEISGGNRDFRKLILGGIRSFNEKTCLQFVPRRNNDKYYIKILDTTRGCSSYVGRLTENDLIKTERGIHYFQPQNGQPVRIKNAKYCRKHET